VLVVGAEPVRIDSTISLGLPGPGGAGGFGAPSTATGATGKSIEILVLK
jgi:hypothetical protein